MRRPLRLLALPAIAGLVVLPACHDAGQQPLSAILVTFDTTRVDAPSCYGRTRGVTPAIDRLAAEGVLYEAAYTVAPITLPAHASMLTGLYPIRHTVRENGLWPLPDEADTLAELARRGGLDTAAFVASAVLDPRFGLDQGFQVYDAPVRPAVERTTHPAERRADEVVDRALAWLRGREADRPYFLWIHLYDPHGPLDPPPEFRTGPLRDQPYLGEVAAADHAVGRLLDELRTRGELERAFVAVVSDHGEAFGDHGEPSHGAYLYEATMRVPFVLRYPDGFRAGERETRIASVVDLFATLGDALGLSVPAGHDGHSLYRRRVDPERGAYLESYMGYLSFGWSPLAGWIDPRGKYLHSAEPEFFDVRSDPGESVDLSGTSSERLDPYRTAIAEISARPRLGADTSAAFDAALLDDVRALGYAATGDPAAELPDPLTPVDRPSPKSRADAYRRMLQGVELANQGRLDEAARSLAGVLEENPGNSLALDRLADCRKRQGRHAEAVVLFRRLLAAGPERPHSLFGLGVCLMETGQHDEARVAFRRTLELAPDLVLSVERMVETLRARGDGALADDYAAALLAGGG